jgi:hypothetical protein
MSAVQSTRQARAVDSDNIASLGARVFGVGKRNDTLRVETQEADHSTTFTVRIFRIQKGSMASAIPYTIEGEILEAGNRPWESFAAYFRMTANHALVGSCSIGEFPDGLHP